MLGKERQESSGGLNEKDVSPMKENPGSDLNTTVKAVLERDHSVLVWVE